MTPERNASDGWSPVLPVNQVVEQRLSRLVWGRLAPVRLVYAALVVFGRCLARAGVRANWITLMSLVPAVAAGVLAARGWLGAAALALIASGACDAIDGIVARERGEASDRGALLDSVVDRLSDSAPLVGLVFFFRHAGLWVLVPAAAIVASLSVSYLRARATALRLDLPRFGMHRPERMLLTSASLASGTLDLPGPAGTPCAYGLALLSVLAFVTVARALWRAHPKTAASPTGALAHARATPSHERHAA